MASIYVVIWLLLLANIGLLFIARFVLKLSESKSKDLKNYYTQQKTVYRN
ncbi:hypothetical protein [Adhaeribacter aerolatus]|nr:hypothetical protein [Adhaeribacter aerolatus]